MKNSCTKEPKRKAFAFRFEQPELSKKAWKEKKKKWQKNRQEKIDKNFAPTTGVNATDTFSGGKKKKNKDLSGIVCYNYKKNGHYANKCLEPLKN